MGLRALAVLVCFAACEASALTQAGSLAADASAAALYQVTCSDDGAGPPASLAVAVLDAAPAAAPLVSVQIQKGSAASNATDPVDGDAGFSPVVFVNGGAGVYDVFVDKTGAGAESFTLFAQCFTGPSGSGAPTGTSIFPSAPQVPVLPPVGWVVLVFLISVCAEASATDLFQIICSDNGSGPPQSLVVQVRDEAPAAAPLVSVQAQRGLLLVSATDATDGDAGSSPAVSVDGGAGAYDVLVDKTGAGVESYTLSYHCFTGPGGTGVHAGTSLLIQQDQ